MQNHRHQEHVKTKLSVLQEGVSHVCPYLALWRESSELASAEVVWPLSTGPHHFLSDSAGVTKALADPRRLLGNIYCTCS